MMRMAAIVGVLALGGCGADGPPVAPSQAGITISGEASIGVKVGQ